MRGCDGSSTSQHSKLAHVYTLIRSHKQQRRAFLKSLLRHFEDIKVRSCWTNDSMYSYMSCLCFIHKSPLGWLLYLADTFAFLPYSTLEEPLFVVHHIEMTISVTGSSLLQQFKEVNFCTYYFCVHMFCLLRPLVWMLYTMMTMKQWILYVRYLLLDIALDFEFLETM